MSSNGNKPSVSHQKSTSSSKASATSNLISVKFEVEGKVQKVHFRKYTQRKASALGLRGWCQNSKYGTVLGCLEGPEVQIEMMKDWLRRVGSPKSIITGAQFNNHKVLEGFTFLDFSIKLD